MLSINMRDNAEIKCDRSVTLFNIYSPVGKKIMHDPMAMRPFMGYNFGHYLQHWLDMEKPGRTVTLFVESLRVNDGHRV